MCSVPLIFIDITGLKMELLAEKSDDLLHCGLDLGQSAGEDQGTAETVHKTDLYIRAFHCDIGSYDNRFPGGKADQADGFPGVVLALMDTDMEPQILKYGGL